MTDTQQTQDPVQELQVKPGRPRKVARSSEGYYLPNNSPFPKSVLRVAMEKAGLSVYGRNSWQLTYVVLSSTKTEGIRDDDAYTKPCEGQKTITFKELILKLLPENGDFDERGLRPFVKRIQVYAGNGQKKPLAYLTSFSFQIGNQNQKWTDFDFQTKSMMSRPVEATCRGMKCFYLAKDILISWKHELDTQIGCGFFLNEIKELFKEASLYEAVSVPEDRKWAFLIYTYERDATRHQRDYPSESDYTASCRVYQNTKKGKTPTLVDLKTLDLYGPLKAEYDVLSEQDKQAIMKWTQKQVEEDHSMRSRVNIPYRWSRQLRKAGKDNRERTIPLIDMQVYDIGQAPLLQKETVTPEQARRAVFGYENYTPRMSMGRRQVVPFQQRQVINPQKGQGGQIDSQDSYRSLEFFHA